MAPEAPKLNKGDAMTKCIVCGVRPSLNGNGTCQLCQQGIDKDRRCRKPEKPFRYVTYRGYVIGMFPDGNGMYQPRLLSGSPKRLPKSITINLNHFCGGFTKDQIKRLKAAVLSCAHA